MAEETFQVAVGEERRVTAVRRSAEGDPTGWVFIYAPGAGSSLGDAFGVFLSEQLAARGVEAWRFQFPYMEEGRRSPDRPAVLEQTWRAVIEACRRADGVRLAVGGRSMGGRYASMVVAKGAAVDALALFAYPLHAPGDPRWRDGHLPEIHVPVLFCSGTRDAFGTPEELSAAAGRIKGAQVHFLEGADHGFGRGRSRMAIYEEAVRVALDWLVTL